MTDEIRFAIECRDDESRQSPGRLSGTILTYEERAGDRPEVFVRGALKWPETGVILNEQHRRDSPIIRFTPYLEGDAVKINVALPNTQRGRDAAVSVRNGTLTGLSVEFRSIHEGRREGLREIRAASLSAAGLVDDPSYFGSRVEVRNKRLGIDEAIWRLL